MESRKEHQNCFAQKNEQPTHGRDYVDNQTPPAYAEWRFNFCLAWLGFSTVRHHRLYAEWCFNFYLEWLGFRT
jgi:hypothetical protein